MKSAIHFQFTFLDMLRSTTDGHLPHSDLELRRAETTTSIPQLEARLHAPRKKNLKKITTSLSNQSVR